LKQVAFSYRESVSEALRRIGPVLSAELESLLDQHDRRRLCQEGRSLLEEGATGLWVPTIAVASPKTWPAFQRKDFLTGRPLETPYRALHATFAVAYGVGDDTLVNRYLSPVLDELGTPERGVRYSRHDGFRCWHNLSATVDGGAALEWVVSHVDEIVVAWNQGSQRVNDDVRSAAIGFLEGLIAEYQAYFGPVEDAMAQLTMATRLNSDSGPDKAFVAPLGSAPCLDRRGLVIGRIVPGVESYSWADVPDELALVDYDAVVLDLTTLELGEASSLAESFGIRRFSALLFAETDKVVFAIGDPRPQVGRANGDTTHAKSKHWWLVAYPTADTEKSARVSASDSRFECYMAHVGQSNFCFDLSTEWSSDHRNPAKEVIRQANQVKTSAEVVAVNGGGRAIGLCLQYVVGIEAETHQVGRKLYRAEFKPLAVSQPIFWLPPPDEKEVVRAIHSLLQAWSVAIVSDPSEGDEGSLQKPSPVRAPALVQPTASSTTNQPQEPLMQTDEPDSQELLVVVESLRNLITAHVTGDNRHDRDYRRLRNEVLRRVNTSDLIPRSLRACEGLAEFKTSLQENEATYKGRRRFLTEEFKPLVDSLAMQPQSDVPAPDPRVSDAAGPTCFISYSHDDQEHADWVHKLATDLTLNGVSVIFDRWDLRLGDDLQKYMEMAIAESQFILMVCTTKYTEKANARSGGVGYESGIVSARIYEGHQPRKFVPITRSHDGTKVRPGFLGNKVYVDFSDDLKYGPSLSKLLQHLHDKHSDQRPPIGKPPLSFSEILVQDPQSEHSESFRDLPADSGSQQATLDAQEPLFEPGSKNLMPLTPGGPSKLSFKHGDVLGSVSLGEALAIRSALLDNGLDIIVLRDKYVVRAVETVELSPQLRLDLRKAKRQGIAGETEGGCVSTGEVKKLVGRLSESLETWVLSLKERLRAGAPSTVEVLRSAHLLYWEYSKHIDENAGQNSRLLDDASQQDWLENFSDLLATHLEASVDSGGSEAFSEQVAKVNPERRTPSAPDRTIVSPSVLLLAAADIEYDTMIDLAGVRSTLDDRTRIVGGFTFVDLGFEAPTWLFMCKAGSAVPGGSAVRALRALQDLERLPFAIIAVGIAFGLKRGKQKLGDILLSEQLCCYEPQRVGSQTVPRGDRVASATDLSDWFRASYGNWHYETSSRPALHRGLLLSGEELVDNEERARQLLLQEPEAIGGEMEGAGLYAAASGLMVRWIVVKGICDWAAGKTKDFQLVAARNAVDFVFHTLAKRSVTEFLKSNRENVATEGGHSALNDVASVTDTIEVTEALSFELEYALAKDLGEKFLFEVWCIVTNVGTRTTGVKRAHVSRAGEKIADLAYPGKEASGELSKQIAYHEDAEYLYLSESQAVKPGRVKRWAVCFIVSDLPEVDAAMRDEAVQLRPPVTVVFEPVLGPPISVEVAEVNVNPYGVYPRYG
jgi:nucleoside phosphorylase